MLNDEGTTQVADSSSIQDALQSLQFQASGYSSRSSSHEAIQSLKDQKRNSIGHIAITRARTPSLASHRRNSFDERRIPPTLPEDDGIAGVTLQHGTHNDLPVCIGQPRTGTATSSSQRPSRELLRRVSTDTALSLDFDSDPESFNPVRPRSIASSTRRSSIDIGGIRLHDNSEHTGTSFARAVQIPAFHTVGSSFGGFVAYECQIVTRDGSILKRMKRYSAFCDLRDTLMRAFPNLIHLVDTLPPKSLAKFRVTFLEKRRKRLAFWLATVLLHPILGGAEEAREWILD